MVPEVGVEPTPPLQGPDFESGASANSTTLATKLYFKEFCLPDIHLGGDGSDVNPLEREEHVYKLAKVRCSLIKTIYGSFFLKLEDQLSLIKLWHLEDLSSIMYPMEILHGEFLSLHEEAISVSIYVPLLTVIRNGQPFSLPLIPLLAEPFLLPVLVILSLFLFGV